MKGRKPNLDKPANVTAFPGAGAPPVDAEAEAAALRPRGLKHAEKQIWNDLAPELVRLGRLKKHYVHAFAEYCRVYVRLQEARKLLDEVDWIYITEGRHGEQMKSRPEVAQLNDDWRKYRSLMAEFGLSPASERGLNSNQGDLFENNEFANLERQA